MIFRRFLTLPRVETVDTDDELDVVVRDETVYRRIEPVPDHYVTRSVDVRERMPGVDLHQRGWQNLLRPVKPDVKPVRAGIFPSHALVFS